MQNDKLRVGFVKSMGVKFGIGDCIKNEGSSAVLGTDWVEMANSTKKISDDWFVESFAPRKNTGEQPCDDDVPVVLEYYRNHKDFGNEKRYAGQVDWACVTTNKSWKPDINELIKLQDAHDKQAKPKRTKVEFVKVDKNADNGKYWECARQFAEGECEFYSDALGCCGVKSNDFLLTHYKSGYLYRKVEREVTWQEEAKLLLTPASRQYKHNDGKGFVCGYDCEEVESIVSKLLASMTDKPE